MNMFCFQCQETARGTGCTVKGVCGKDPQTAAYMDVLLYAVRGIAIVNRTLREKGTADNEIDHFVLDALFCTITNANFDDEAIIVRIKKAFEIKNILVGTAKKRNIALPDMPEVAYFVSEENYIAEAAEVGVLSEPNEDLRSLKQMVIYGVKGAAAYTEHALNLGFEDHDIYAMIENALAEISRSDISAEELVSLVLNVGECGVKAMALLDKANTSSYGNPEITKVNIGVGKRPGILVSGHDLKDLQLLLEQTEGKGINIYTHGEMLPAHAYPLLKKFSHLKGNFGTAWQNQQKEFDHLPAPILYTTNCLMPPKSSYADRVFTTEVVAFPGAVHIDEKKDFTPVIEKALELGGYKEDQTRTGINGGTKVTTGFGHAAILSHADTVVEAVKSGAIRHFFLVAGCDGAKPGRNYYTEFVKQTPSDSIVLTLACGKFRFNDLDLGEIGGLPRLMDMGQCNDAYGAIQVAVALADAFGCSVNELPLSFVLSWYEQKAVCILLTLLHLGIKNIRLGPSLPAFLSPNILNYLVENYGIAPITTPEEDIKTLLNHNK